MTMRQDWKRMLSTRMQGFVNRWQQATPDAPQRLKSRAWLVYRFKKLGEVSTWDHDSANDLLDLCTDMQLFTPLVSVIDDDLSTWGVDNNACKMLYNYLSKFF